MSVLKEDLIQLAHKLTDGLDEVSWRAGVSRAYYAAYHGCLTWHAALPAPGSYAGRDGGNHQQLINQLKNSAPECSDAQKQISRVLSIQLGALKARRHIADYQLTGVFDKATALSNCAQAADIINRL